MGRVYIAELSGNDGDEFVAAMRASVVFHHPYNAPPQSHDDFAALMHRTSDPTFYSLLARRTADQQIVGYFNISNIIRGLFQNAFLGYGASVHSAGRGYMTDAMRLVLDFVFGPLALHRLEANIQPGNAPSLALVARCGFVKEGFSERYLRINGDWRDHERWAIRSEQWREFSRSDDPPARSAV